MCGGGEERGDEGDLPEYAVRESLDKDSNGVDCC